MLCSAKQLCEHCNLIDCKIKDRIVNQMKHRTQQEDNIPMKPNFVRGELLQPARVWLKHAVPALQPQAGY
jgi:hypothetical protein